MSTKTATLLHDVVHPVSRAIQKTYRLDPPMQTRAWGEPVRDVSYVIVSAVDVPFSGPETLIFEGDADGNIIDFCDLEGSFRGDMDHEQALRNVGYEVQS